MWSQTIGNPNDAAASVTGNAVYPTSDGGFVVVGDTQSEDSNLNVMLIKTDAQGNTEWANAEIANGPGKDAAVAVKETTDGGFIILATVRISNNDVISLIKTDSKGRTFNKN